MTRRLLLVPISAALLALAGCATAVPPVSVTRFHTPAVASLTSGTVYQLSKTVDAGLEATSYRLAVENELRRLGFVAASPGGPSPLVVRVTVERQDRLAQGQSPVSVGVGGGTGGYGSGVGVGIGFNLGGGPRRWTDLTLAVLIDDAASGTALWEGRAQTAVPAKAPGAQPSLAAAKMAAALFGGFPGPSGTTITVP
jgi:Domain of unknown function (DUF4136)